YVPQSIGRQLLGQVEGDADAGERALAARTATRASTRRTSFLRMNDPPWEERFPWTGRRLGPPRRSILLHRPNAGGGRGLGLLYDNVVGTGTARDPSVPAPRLISPTNSAIRAASCASSRACRGAAAARAALSASTRSYRARV